MPPDDAPEDDPEDEPEDEPVSELIVTVQVGTGGAKALESIVISGYTNEYTVGSTFNFDGTVTATYNYAEMNPISVAVTFGKGSEVLFDFEDGDVSQWLDWRGMEEAIASGAYTGGYTMP